MKRISKLRNSVLVVAHPDDEVLWFSSLLKKIDKVIIIFKDFYPRPEIGEQRAKAIAKLPFEVVWLAIPEAGTYGLGNWEQPELSPFGLIVEDAASTTKITEDYERNFHDIHTQLKKHLSSDMTVFTHNPWGEYGHPDHVQTYRIIESLRANLEFHLYVSSYASSKSMSLVQYYADTGVQEPITGRIDSTNCNQIADSYKQHDCWTWADDWIWDKEEYFLGNPQLRQAGCHSNSLASSTLLRQIPSSVKNRKPGLFL
ncbi:MAG: hypothetical protein O3C43_17155 [Verrucomicrobia bacterium]|nr:hypothetical protein [Verrucomicrobiota bacterium]